MSAARMVPVSVNSASRGPAVLSREDRSVLSLCEMTTGVSTGRTAVAVEVGQKIVVEDGMSSYSAEVRRV